MFLQILMMILSSEMTKQLIGLGVKKLLEHKSDGITKEVAETMLDGIALSRANDVPADAFDIIKHGL